VRRKARIQKQRLRLIRERLVMKNKDTEEVEEEEGVETVLGSMRWWIGIRRVRR
jgi:hypothetical protein